MESNPKCRLILYKLHLTEVGQTCQTWTGPCGVAAWAASVSSVSVTRDTVAESVCSETDKERLLASTILAVKLFLSK